MTNVDLPPRSPSSMDEARLARARRRVAALKGFYIHLSVFVLVMAGLAVINLLTGRVRDVHPLMVVTAFRLVPALRVICVRPALPVAAQGRGQPRSTLRMSMR